MIGLFFIVLAFLGIGINGLVTGYLVTHSVALDVALLIASLLIWLVHRKREKSHRASQAAARRQQSELLATQRERTAALSRAQAEIFSPAAMNRSRRAHRPRRRMM